MERWFPSPCLFFLMTWKEVSLKRRLGTSYDGIVLGTLWERIILQSRGNNTIPGVVREGECVWCVWRTPGSWCVQCQELHHVEFCRPQSNLWTKFWMIQKAMGVMVDNRLSLYDSCFKRSFWLLCGQMHNKWCKTELGNHKEAILMVQRRYDGGLHMYSEELGAVLIQHKDRAYAIQ